MQVSSVALLSLRGLSRRMASNFSFDPLQKTSSELREVKKPRVFDFNKFNKRHVALRVAYIGWKYSGFAIQDPPKITIESCLFECLKKTKLIKDVSTAHYSRCGRTDKGVSALGQVIALDLRTNLLSGPGVRVQEGSNAHTRKGDTENELPYMVILNRNLPEDIRVLSWTPVDPEFSARFNCTQRTYKYFFPRGDMNLELMRTAAQYFIGQHDFRNFCKMDIAGGVTHFDRTIVKFEINALSSSNPPSPYDMCEMTLSGHAFLMHQVRCMAGILFLIGNGLETPDIVQHMLDIEKCPCKPQYGMAPPEPLILYDCVFDGLQWQREEEAHDRVVAHFQHMWTSQVVKSTMVQCMLDTLSPPTHSSYSSHSTHPSPMAILMHSDHRLGKGRYKPLLERPTANTFEERYEHHQAKKMKLQQQQHMDIQDTSTSS